MLLVWPKHVPLPLTSDVSSVLALLVGIVSQSILNACHSPRLLFWKCIIGIARNFGIWTTIVSAFDSLKLIQNFLKATEGQFQTECTENCGWGTHIWVGACIQIKSRTAAKSSSKYKTHSNIMLYTALVQLVMIWIFTAYIFLMERLYICLHFFLLCFRLFWGFLICPILGFLFTSSLDQYSEEESLNAYGDLHLKNHSAKSATEPDIVFMDKASEIKFWHEL